MICPYCGAEIPEDTRFCPECGASLSEETAGGENIEREVYSLLATANLYRIRGLWQEAENKCVEVLRKYPNNPAAHSLLGDIYADQGKWEEAKEWYELAVELNPSSTADKKKLERVLKVLEDRQKQTKGKMVSWGAVAFALMALSFSFFLFYQWKKTRTSVALYRPHLSTNLPMYSNYPMPSIPLATEESTSFPPVAFTKEEDAIYLAIVNAKLPDVGGLKVSVNSLTKRATIDILAPVPFELSAINTVIVRTGFPALQLAAQKETSIEYFILRILVPVESSVELAFQGGLSRIQLSQATADTILYSFSEFWLNPSLSPLPSQ
ncbi:tetratricopeptide repeat protein [bacterium]|nr:tetratricopeptide repeat protein [bacterium]